MNQTDPHQNIVIKTANVKQKILKAVRPPKKAMNFLYRNTTGEWQDTFKVLKGKNLQPRILYPARI